MSEIADSLDSVIEQLIEQASESKGHIENLYDGLDKLFEEFELLEEKVSKLRKE